MTEAVTKADDSTASRSPMLARESLRRLIRKRFKASGLTIVQVAERCGISVSAADRWLKGEKRYSERDVRDLCAALDGDEEFTARIRQLAKDANKRNIAEPMDWAGPSDFLLFVEFEQAATSVWTYETSLVPGVLQTPAYAEIVIRDTVSDDRIVSHRVDLRMQRQQIIQRADSPTQFTAVIDESVLHRRPANRAVMVEQLQHLLMLGSLPNVTLRVIPFAAGPLPIGSIGAFTVMRVPELGHVAYGENPAVMTLLETGTAKYTETAHRLEGHALGTVESARIIESALSEMG